VGQNATNEALWRVLHTIDRSILPRTIDLRTSKGQLQIEARASKVLICPRVGGSFFLDDELKRDAPDVWEILRGGTDAVVARGEVLASARLALVKLCARALIRVTSGVADVTYNVKALRPVERAANGSPLPSYTAFELAVSLAPALRAAAQGPVAAFYRQIAPKLADAWLFDHTGRPAGYPARVTRLAEIEDMAKTVASALTWREHLSGVVGPVMSVFVESSRESVRCLAVDAGYVALVSGTGLEMAAMLSAWRAVQQGSGAT
jgi:hypothetical protein